MNKIIFQIGCLSFFVAVVAFALENYPLIDTISRAFIVFISVVVVLSAVVGLSLMVAAQERRQMKDETRATPKTAHPAA